jgi:uncharacterized protein (DUF433 family)
MSRTTVEDVEQTADGGWRLTDSRVSFDSVIHGYWDGRSPEAIAEEFPGLPVEQIYGAIAFYLRNRAEIDRYLNDQSERWRQLQLESEVRHGPLLNRIRSRRMPQMPDEVAP